MQQGGFTDARPVGAGVDGKVVSTDADAMQLIGDVWQQGFLQLL